MPGGAPSWEGVKNEVSGDPGRSLEGVQGRGGVGGQLPGDRQGGWVLGSCPGHMPPAPLLEALGRQVPVPEASSRPLWAPAPLDAAGVGVSSSVGTA